jgi:uncharacterized SAM-binding protein YcdF (DUF218 family)
MKRRKTSKPRTKRTVKSAVFSVAKFLITFATTLLVCGFIAFALHISGTEPADPLPKADGIVVLTGKGGGRLNAGAELLRKGFGERLLVSGVNPSLDAEKMREVLNLEDDLFTCCVNLDYEAENTYQNGLETANWARAMGYERIILVTSSYHMPRAKVEISTAMDGIKIIPYPVKREKTGDEPWWGGEDYAKRILREYGKLLVTYAREPGVRARKQTMSPEIDRSDADKGPRP